jgi:glutathione synthase/RimK-type ligase-like ATP-grasp enzyme
LILVVSHAADDHACGVLQALLEHGYPAVLVDTARYPSNAALSQRFGEGGAKYELTIDGQAVDLSACRVGWWRRPQPFTLHPGLAPDAAAFTYTECHEAIAGLWAALDVTWVNQPERDEIAHHKPFQLAVATEVGFPIPRTLITNDPAEARDFANNVGLDRTVYKTFLATEECWRETRVLRDEEMAILDQVRYAPVIFQEFVPAIADIRATVIGDRIFAAAISQPSGAYDVDYRMGMETATFEATSLPPETENRIHALMRRLGLVYGAIDLRRTKAGEHIFLEVNPAGEWRFVEERTHQPITDAMARLLMELDQR